MASDIAMPDPICKCLDWDTQFFGVRIGQLVPKVIGAATMDTALDWCRREVIRCLYFQCDPADDESVRLAERNGFHLVDVRVVFGKEIGPAESPADACGVPVRRWRERDLPALDPVAAESYRDTRFWYDRNFPRDRVTALYREWLNRSCHGFADEVLVAEVDGRAGGFITCHLDTGSKGRVGLVGVSADLRGKGVGKALLAAATEYFAAARTSRVEVATQARNLAAQRLYQRSGFVTSSVGLWYHLWL